MWLHRKVADWGDGGLMDQVHLVTDALYGAPADRLEDGGRAEAVAIPPRSGAGFDARVDRVGAGPV